MRIFPKAGVVIAAVCLTCIFAVAGARAQTISVGVSNIALKNGESTEFGDVYFISTNCKSLLKGTPEVEIMDGPPGVTVAIKPAQVVPHGYSCAKPVAGGKLVISAKDVEDFSRTQMVVRVSYKTAMGPRQRSSNINVTLFP